MKTHHRKPVNRFHSLEGVSYGVLVVSKRFKFVIQPFRQCKVVRLRRWQDKSHSWYFLFTLHRHTSMWSCDQGKALQKLKGGVGHLVLWCMTMQIFRRKNINITKLTRNVKLQNMRQTFKAQTLIVRDVLFYYCPFQAEPLRWVIAAMKHINWTLLDVKSECLPKGKKLLNFQEHTKTEVGYTKLSSVTLACWVFWSQRSYQNQSDHSGKSHAKD